MLPSVMETEHVYILEINCMYNVIDHCAFPVNE